MAAAATGLMIETTSDDELAGQTENRRRYDSGEFVIDRAALNDAPRDVTISGVTVRLTRTEYRILEYLMQNPERWVSREEIMTAVLGKEPRSDYALVRVHLCNIRRKLGPLASRLSSRRRLGTMFHAE
jgi:DNA-binding response OmpR family regulator